jgi:hypothetical protein
VATKYYRCALEYTLGSQLMVNTFSVMGDSATHFSGADDAQALADFIGGNSSFTGAWQGVTPSAMSIDQLLVTEMLSPTDTALPEVGSHSIGINGTLGGADVQVPDSLCCVLTLRTNAHIRSGHGRMFLPPVHHADWISGQLVTSGYGALVDALIAELGHWNEGGTRWGIPGGWGIAVYSRTRRSRAIEPPAFWVTGYTRHDQLTWLRSRRSVFA